MKTVQRLLNRICNSLIGHYYIFIIFIYFITFSKKGLPVGALSAVIMMVIAVCVVLCSKIKCAISVIDAFVIFYIIYCLCTTVSYAANDINLSVFVKAASNSLLPLVFYWCAKREVYSIYRFFWWANCLCCVAGILLLLVMPTWYFQYCAEYGYSFTRLSSCVGSTAVGCMCAVASVIAVQYMHSTGGKKGKIQYLLSILFSFASMQRSAWIVVLATLVLAHIFIFFKWRSVKLRYLAIEILGILTVLFVFKDQIIALIERWIAEHKVAGGYGMFSSRTGQWIEALKSSNIIFGNGYGSAGHKAIGYADAVVADGSWVCLLCEIGIVGITIFLMILFFVIGKGICNIKALFLPLGVVVCIAMQAIGSNMFEYQLIAPVFWYAIGHIANYSKKNEVEESESFRNLSSAVS